MINTYCRFFYGYVVTSENQFLDFIEGTGVERTAEIAVGSYSATDFCVAVKTALDAAGDLTYTVSLNRMNQKITIAATGNFKILSGDGSHSGNDPMSLLGFNEPATSLSLTHTGDFGSGLEFKPQLWLQEYVASDDQQSAVDAKKNKTASGRVEVVKFGVEKFMECNIKYQTALPQPSGSYLRNNPNGEIEVREFLQYLVTQAPVEFMPDENAPEIFETLLLESTPESQDGVGYKLKEMWDVGLLGHFQTGRLKFRKIES